MSQRTSTVITTAYLVVRGILQKGMTFYGPFDNEGEAAKYCGKNFPDETAYIMPMYKEEHVLGNANDD